MDIFKNQIAKKVVIKSIFVTSLLYLQKKIFLLPKDNRHIGKIGFKTQGLGLQLTKYMIG